MNAIKEIPAISKVELCYFRNGNNRQLSTKSNSNMYANNYDGISFNDMLLDEISNLRSNNTHTM